MNDLGLDVEEIWIISDFEENFNVKHTAYRLKHAVLSNCYSINISENDASLKSVLSSNLMGSEQTSDAVDDLSGHQRSSTIINSIAYFQFSKALTI